MFINCSECNSKYIINSADLKPNGRMVQCAVCGHQWFQDLKKEEIQNLEEIIAEFDSKNNNKEHVPNLPSTVIQKKKVSTLNSFLVIIFVFLLFFAFWLLKSYGINIFVLINFYIIEFYFNLKLIITDIAKIIHQTINWLVTN